MAVYLITYDLNRETVRPPVLEKIRTYNWQRLSESSYVVSTSQTAAQIYRSFQHMLDSNDDFYVCPLTGPAIGFGRKPVVEWLNRFLR